MLKSLYLGSYFISKSYLIHQGRCLNTHTFKNWEYMSVTKHIENISNYLLQQENIHSVISSFNLNIQDNFDECIPLYTNSNPSLGYE